MLKKSPNHLADLIDGLVAVFIVTFNFVPRQSSWAAIQVVPSLRIDAVDALFGVTFIFVWYYFFSVRKLYNKFATLPDRLAAVIKGVSFVVLPVLAHIWLFHPELLKPGAVIGAVSMLLCYEVLRLFLNGSFVDWLASRDPRRVVIVGSGRRASKTWRTIRTQHHSSVSLIGFVDDRHLDELSPDVKTQFLGTVDELSDLLLREVVDIVVIAMPIQSCYSLMQKAVYVAESAGVQVVYLDDIYSSKYQGNDSGQTVFRELLQRREDYLLHLMAKRALDIFGSLAGMILLAPLFVLVAMGVKLTSKGPVLFRQERYGYRRRRFKMLKFRSMVEDAEQLMSSLEDLNEATGPIFKIKNDPRLTKIGKFLRSTSLDELPQLWNVLVGQMSLVGPRPMSIRDVSCFSESALMRRFSVKPGLTGLWQVSGRSAVGFDEWMVMDNRYIDGWSLILDVKILAKTVGVVVRRHGAM